MHMANTCATWQQAAHTTYHLPFAQQKPYKKQQKQLSLNEKCWRKLWWKEKKGQENSSLAEKQEDWRIKKTSQKNERW